MNCNIILDGWFQTSLYFQNYADKLRSFFKLPENKASIVNEYVSSLRKKYIDKKLIGIHIRRTDYVKLSWELPIEYYTTCVKKFDENCVFICISDDIKWCKENLPNNGNVEFVENIKDVDDVCELFIFSMMDSYIISNSSFSWWGVFLGDLEKNKKVFAPYPWIKDSEYCPKYNKNIYELYWEKINIEEIKDLT